MDRWPLTGACLANNNRADVDDDKINTEMWYCNYRKIIVTNGDVKLIDKNMICTEVFYAFSLGFPLTGA